MSNEVSSFEKKYMLVFDSIFSTEKRVFETWGDVSCIFGNKIYYYIQTSKYEQSEAPHMRITYHFKDFYFHNQICATSSYIDSNQEKDHDVYTISEMIFDDFINNHLTKK